MEGKPPSYRRLFVYIITVVTVIFLSLLMATKTYTSNGPTTLEMPSPRSNAIVSEAIRGDHGGTFTTLMDRSSSLPTDRHSTINIASTKGDGPMTSDMKKPKSYYMGLSCPKEKAKPGVNLPKITLASFPRSGNGWTRHLIQYATGLYVGSQGWIGRPSHANLDTFPATGDDIKKNRVVITKTHGTPTPDMNNEAVLLIRNPYRSFVSDVYNRIFRRKNFSKKEMLAFFKTDNWVKEVTRMSNGWTATATMWISDSKRLLVVSNERLFNNTEGELRRILDFIHQPIDKERLQCAVKTFYPQASSIKFKIDPYTDELKTLIDSCIEKVNRTLSERRLPTLPTFEPISIY